MTSISQAEFAQWQAAQTPLTLIDVRRAEKRAADAHDLVGAVWYDPAKWLDWKDTIPKHQVAVLYCAHGQEISQGLTAALRVLGVPAYYLVGGWAAYRSVGT